MLIIDAHCDTITRIMETGSNLYKNNCHIDLERMKKAGSFIQFFAAFIDPVYSQAYAMKRAIQIIDMFYEQVTTYKEHIMPCFNSMDIQESIKSGKIGALLTIEGGEALQGDLSALRMFYRLGVRSICLTWNNRNEIADGVSDSITGGGLTLFGREVIKEMNRLGMLIDLSHISEKGFWDVMDVTNSPVIVTHSNAKGICNHQRNLSDNQIKALKDNGGVIGINFYPYFLTGTNKALIKDIVNHIEYIAGIAGINHIGIGADFDGIECLPEDMRGVEDLYKLFNELLKLNYSHKEVEGIAGYNLLRLIKQIIQSP
ncbi:MAG: dipeptidase [Acetivibrionales bacterium]